MEFKTVCIKDSSVNQWIYPLENCTYSASRLLKSRGMFNVPVLDFDLSALKGKTVKKAWLYLRYRTHPMKKYEISTISAPWDEGDGDGMENPGISRSFGFAVLDAKAQFYLPYKISTCFSS